MRFLMNLCVWVPASAIIAVLYVLCCVDVYAAFQANKVVYNYNQLPPQNIGSVLHSAFSVRMDFLKVVDGFFMKCKDGVSRGRETIRF